GRALGRLLEPAVEPHRAVERTLLIQQEVLQIVTERQQIVFGREGALLPRPRRDRVDDTADELLHRSLALRRADLSPEVLGDDDVGGLLGPDARNLDIALLEEELPAFVRDQGRAQLPFDLVERIDAVSGKG